MYSKSLLKKLGVFLFAVGSLTACKKDNDIANPKGEKGIFILNEGGFNQNNSTLSFYEYQTQTVTRDTFSNINKRSLGDVGNDLLVYGSKMYIVVNVSSTIEVTDAKTVRSIKQISLKGENDLARQPRSMVSYEGKIFVSNYDGTVAVLDTASLNIEKYIPVGRNPEQMAIANGKLYVANSGGLDFPNYDNTVSVIDLNTLTETKKITVTLNPGNVVADAEGDVYVKSTGNYDDVAPALTIIDSETDEVKQVIENFQGGNLTISGHVMYASTYTGIITFDVQTEQEISSNFISDGTVIAAPNGLLVDQESGDVFVADAGDYASNGKVFCFGSNGKLKYSLTAGLLPRKMILRK